MRLDGIRTLVLIICLPTFPAHPAAEALVTVSAELAHHPRAAHFFLSLELLEPSCEVDLGLTLLALLRGHCMEGCPPLLHVFAFAVRTDNLALLMLRECQDFRELFLAGPTEIIVLGHSSFTRSSTSALKSAVLTPMPACASFMDLPAYVQGPPPAWQIWSTRFPLNVAIRFGSEAVNAKNLLILASAATFATNSSTTAVMAFLPPSRS